MIMEKADLNELTATIAKISRDDKNNANPYKSIKLIIDAIDLFIAENKNELTDRATTLLYELRNANSMFLSGNSVKESMEMFDEEYKKHFGVSLNISSRLIEGDGG